MTITLRSLRAALNAADPYEKHPHARVAKARDGLARAEVSGGDLRYWGERIASAERKAIGIQAGRVLAWALLEGGMGEIAALFDTDAATMVRKIEGLEYAEGADEAEVQRTILAALLASVEKRLEASTPAPPTIGDALIVARAFLEAPGVETLRILAETAHAAGAPGAAWGRIRDLLTRIPRKSGPVLVSIPPSAIEIAWPGARYRFGAGHRDDTLGIGA
jgi:hypothetical protein